MEEVAPRVCESGRPPRLGSSPRAGRASGAGLGTLTQARDGLALNRDGGDGARTEPDDASSSDMSARELHARRHKRAFAEEEEGEGQMARSERR